MKKPCKKRIKSLQEPSKMLAGIDSDYWEHIGLKERISTLCLMADVIFSHLPDIFDELIKTRRKSLVRHRPTNAKPKRQGV